MRENPSEALGKETILFPMLFDKEIMPRQFDEISQEHLVVTDTKM